MEVEIEASALGCSSIWHQTTWDWSNCMRIKVFNSFLPLVAISISFSIILLRFVFSTASKKKNKLAERVARLDPKASTFQLGNGISNGISNGNSNGISNGDGHHHDGNIRPSNPILTLLQRLLPWNSTRFFSSSSASQSSAFQIPSNPATSSISNLIPNSTSDTSHHHQRNERLSSFAAKAVRQAENAVILHEVISTPLQRQTQEEKSQFKLLELVKRFSETLLSITLASVYVADWISTENQKERNWKLNWVLLWSYLSLLSAHTLTTSHSFFKHKALILFLAFIISISNLRSEFLSTKSSNLALTSVELVLTFLTLVPTLFFPLKMRLPARLRAIHSTMRAEKRHGIARTVLPTPNVARALSPSVSRAGEEQELLAQEDEEEEDGRQNQADEDADAEATANEGGIDVEEIRAALLRDSKREGSEEEKSKIPSPEVFASLFDRATFGFVTPAMWKHYKIPFRPETVPELPSGDKAAAVVASYRAAFESSTENSNSKNTKSSGLKKSSRPLHVRLFIHFMPFLVIQFFWALLQACMVLTPAIGMRYILAYIAQRDRIKRGELEKDEIITPVHMAVLYAFVMLAGQMLSSISASQALFIGRRICIQLRAILITEIVTKSLRRRENSGGKSKETEDSSKLTEEEKRKKDKDEERTTDGQVVNLISVDVFKVSEICAYLHFICPQSPVQIALCLYLLFNLLGWAAFVGFLILLASIPLQTITASLFVKLQRELLEATDERLNLVTEVLSCIKTVKFFAWERSFESRMNQTRQKELRVLRNRFGAYLLNALTFVGTPMLVTVVTFSVHTKVLHRPLDAETAFTSLSIFQLLKFPLDALPDLLINILSSLVSVRRIDKYLQEDETEKYEQLLSNEEDSESLGEEEIGKPLVGFQDASFTFASEDSLDSNSFVLKDLNLIFPTEALSIIAGPVGSGKTALLLSLLGETRRISGNTFFPCPISRALVETDPQTGLADTVAYCSQSAWLLGTTIKENILFGSDYDEKRYKACLKACALEPDLKVLEFGDATQVGEKGTALSGGQKARVALCRALYSTSRFLLIDDALSAVDAHTAEHLYSQYLTGPLAKGRTIILVTHAVSLCLPGSSFVVSMDDGRVVASGSPEKVRASGVFADETPSGSSDGSVHEESPSNDKGKEKETNIEELVEGGQTEEERAQLEKKQERAKAEEEETYAKGSVGFKTYALYFKSLSPNPLVIFTFWFVLVALFITSRGTDVSSAAWLRKWAGSYDRREESLKQLPQQASLAFNTLVSHFKIPNFLVHLPESISANSTLSVENSSSLPPLQFQVQQSHRPILHHQELLGASSLDSHPFNPEVETTKYLTVYALLALTYVLLTILRDATTFYGSLRSSKALYKKLISSILNATPRFHDKTPSGRVLNRLSKDVETIDQELSPVLLFLLDILLQTVSILAVVIYAVPEFAYLAIFIMLVFAAIGAIYLTSSRDLKRIESVQRSPIYSLIGEVLNGAVAIRAFGDSGRFTRHCLRLIDKASSPFFFLWYENRWLSIRTDLIAASVAAIAALLLIFNKDADASLSGFTLSYSIMLLETILWIVRLYTQVEISMNSVERLDEYMNIEAERQGGTEPPAHWPSRSGTIKVKNLSVRYAKEFPLVLDQVSFSVKSGEKIALCGRTGSGKSSLALAFFRFLEAESGSISIDGIDISTIPLSTLRSKLTVIPQESQLFSGTVRSNLDPFNQHEDSALWFALERCRLASRGSTLNTPAVSRPASPGPGPDGEEEEVERNTVTSLEMKVENGGKNFSSGQRQLLSLARGLLRMQDSNILLLDEATSNMDSATDALIQKAVREELGKESILFVIAHRLRTIADFDKIVVLDRGKLLEFDSPANLLRDPNSSFYDLAKKSGDFNLLMETALKHEGRAE